MLANWADIYNLGDTLGGMQEAFALSYTENSLTSNPVLAPLPTRDMADLYLLVEKARGKDVSTNALKHGYSGAEVNEIVAVLQRLMQVRDVVYRVNQQYIASAAQADKYRVEPPFKLQGSYRNMNKLAEKISPVMNEAELQQLIGDHYLGESQLLTTGAEENLLKLAELRGVLSAEQQARWTQIKADFLRNKAMGADDADVGGRMVAQLADIAGNLDALRAPPVENPDATPWPAVLDALRSLQARPQATTPQQAAPDFEALRAAMQGQQAPVIEILRATLARQDMLNSALLELAEVLARAPAATTTTAGDAEAHPRKSPTRVRSQRDIAFDKELQKLRFKHELDDKDGKPG